MASAAVPIPVEIRVPAEEPAHRLDELTAVHVGQSALVLSRRDGSAPVLVITDPRRGLVPFGLCLSSRADADTDVPPARQLLVTKLAALLARTTGASRQDLAAGADRRFCEHTHLVASALRGSGDMPRAISAARTWGATSGIDLASGMRAAVTAVLTSRREAHLLDGRTA